MKKASVPFKIPPKTLSLLKRVGRLAEERGEMAYAVGGFVRDLFLKRPGMDIDITVEGDGLAFAEKLARQTGSQVEAFTRFGTSIVVIPGFGKVDIATARTENYASPGALPAVERSGITQDLYRRDFTVNAMALSLIPGYFLRLLDPFGGLADLKRGRIRALHERSFIDDPTRVFRAVRFEQRFQKRIEKRTQKWLLAAVKGNYLKTVSGERLRNELRLIFHEPRPAKAVLRLGELGVLPSIHESLGLKPSAKKKLPQIEKALAFFHRHKIPLEEESMVWFQSLLSNTQGGEIQDLCQRLKLSRHEQKITAQSAKAAPAALRELEGKGVAVSRIHKLLCALRPEVQCFLLAGAKPVLRKKMEDYFTQIREAKPWIRGRDLQSLGIPPGFRYSFILLEALNGQLDRKFKSRKEALEWVKKSFVS